MSDADMWLKIVGWHEDGWEVSDDKGTSRIPFSKAKVVAFRSPDLFWFKIEWEEFKSCGLMERMMPA